MVVSQGHRMVRSGVSLCGLARVLRQHRHDECNDCLVCSLNALRLDFRRDLRSATVSCLEAQSFYLQDAIRSMGQGVHLRAVWDGQPTSPPLNPEVTNASANWCGALPWIKSAAFCACEAAETSR